MSDQSRPSLRHLLILPRGRPGSRGRAATAYGSVSGMTTHSDHRGGRIERIGLSRYIASNDHGGQITVGAGAGTDFTPVELLLAAIGGGHGVPRDPPTPR